MINPISISELRALVRAHDTQGLSRHADSIEPAVLAGELNELGQEEVWRVLTALPVKGRAEVFADLDLDLQLSLVEGRGKREMAALLEEMPSDDRADLVQGLGESLREEILPLVARAERADIRRLVAYAEETAGALMTTDYAALPEDICAGDALQRLRREAPDKETIHVVYVVDEKRRLKGSLSLKDLVLARPQRPVAELMHPETPLAKTDEDREQVAHTFARYDLVALPVVARDNVLVGIITVDDVFDVIEEEASEDAYRMGAAGTPLDYLRANPFRIAQQRIVWLLALVAMGFVCGFVIQRYSDLIETMIALTFFLPLLCDCAGNAGCQASTVIVRGLATEELDLADALRVLRKEIAVGAIVGVAMAVLAAARALILNGSVPLALTVALAMLTVVVMANILGGLLPLVFKRLGFDPALMSAPLITTVVDITSLFVYFELAKRIIIA